MFAMSPQKHGPAAEIVGALEFERGNRKIVITFY